MITEQMFEASQMLLTTRKAQPQITKIKRNTIDAHFGWIIKNDGSLYEISNTDETSLVKVMDNVVSVASGAWGDCVAIKEDNTLWLFESEKLDNTTYFNDGTSSTIKYAPIKVMDDVVETFAERFSLYVRKNNGTIYVLGNDLSINLGDNGVECNIDARYFCDRNTKILSCGDVHNAVLDYDGSLWIYGDYYEPLFDSIAVEGSNLPKAMDNVASVVTDYSNTIALKYDGSLWVWSDICTNENGDDDLTFKGVAPVKIMDNVAIISSDWGEITAIKNDGSLWLLNSWSNYKKLDDKTFMQEYEFKNVKSEEIIVAAKGNFILKSDGSLWQIESYYDGETKYSLKKIADDIMFPSENLIAKKMEAFKIGNIIKYYYARLQA